MNAGKCPPVGSDPHQDIHNDNVILPFLENCTLDDLEAGFGVISEVTIAPSMQVSAGCAPNIVEAQFMKAGEEVTL